MTIDPKALDLSILPSVPLSDRLQLPPVSGIYFAITNGKVQYVGRSVNIRQRWEYHHRTNQLNEENTCIAYLEVSDANLLPEIEIALIEWFDPPLNGSACTSLTKSDGRIIWKLNEMMAVQRKRNKDLAEFLGVSENAVCRLRKRDDMPRITGETLDGICAFLNCQPRDLLVRSIALTNPQQGEKQ